MFTPVVVIGVLKAVGTGAAFGICINAGFNGIFGRPWLEGSLKAGIMGGLAGPFGSKIANLGLTGKVFAGGLISVAGSTIIEGINKLRFGIFSSKQIMWDGVLGGVAGATMHGFDKLIQKLPEYNPSSIIVLAQRLGNSTAVKKVLFSGIKET